jgi:hypothetical protein
MKVKNVAGTSDSSCKCSSWLDHWKKFGGGDLPSYCVESTCLAKPAVGAHVQKDNAIDKSWYIVPLCAKHNAKTSELSVIDGIKLVPANVSETCGKSTAAGGIGFTATLGGGIGGRRY